ncbi:peptidoglycan-binding domain-containing protein [Ekhidna sp.]|uniref:peptidoglycan-binding domain-containing protein n=1 Tax=Ekhidna sp. TaxID=2608089 RepID=UPI003BA9D35E
MKKILFVILIITLPLIAYFQYKDYKRFNPPTSYEYIINDGVDVNYHDQLVVDEYFTKSLEIGSFARMVWNNHSIDVRFPDQNSELAMNSAANYNRLISRVKQLEAILLNSTSLKEENFSNEDIKLIESGMPVSLVKSNSDEVEIIALTLGDQNRYVWELQKRLIAKGYDHQLDGLFGTDTQTALISYQRDNGFYPSGRMNEQVFRSLFLD